MSDDPCAHPEGFLADLNPSSEEVFPKALLEIGYNEVHQKAPWPAECGESNTAEKEAKSGVRPEAVRFQGVRVGYFCVDSDSTPEKLILNQIVTLKDSAGKV